MAIYKNWKTIAELEDDKNFLKLRLLVEENQEILKKFKELYPDLFCDEPVNLCVSRSLLIHTSKEIYLKRTSELDSDFLELEKKEFVENDNLENAIYWSERAWEYACIKLGIPIVFLDKNSFGFWLESELFGNSGTFQEIRVGYKIKIFGKELLIIDFNPLEGYNTYILALVEHIDMNS